MSDADDRPQNAIALQAVSNDPVKWVPALDGFDLLDDSMVPSDWRDPAALVRRTEALVAVAHQAAEMLIEMLLALPGEKKARLNLLRNGGCVMVSTNATFDLHAALSRYKSETLRFDGEELARDSINRNYGAAVALLTMTALEETRKIIVAEMQRHWEAQVKAHSEDFAEAEASLREIQAEARREGRLTR
jgi:hypothetical protein